MPEYIMQFDVDETGKLINARRKEELIRCRDCRFYQDNNGGYPHIDCKWDANETPDEDDYCSLGERKISDT